MALKHHKTLLAFLFVVFATSTFEQSLYADSYKVRNIQQVIESIANATGNIRGVPQLRMSKNPGFIAEYDPASMEIIVSEHFYDFCTGFGKDSLAALACILGHELGHYYMDHEYSGGFNEILGAKQNNSVSLEHKKLLEAKADMFGLKYAFYAGYASYQILPRVLEMIYKNYKVTSTQGYPTKEQRIQIASDQVEKIKPLVYLFDAAVFLQINKYFKEAALLYDCLLKQDFVSVEVLNNLGAVKLSMALEIPDKDSKSELFFFPCEIDPGERLKSVLNCRAITKADVNQKATLLDEAEKYFQQARLRKDDLSAVYHNLATVYLLQNKYPSAIDVIKDMELVFKQSGKSFPANYYLMKGIALSLNQELKPGLNYLEKALEKGAYKAKENMAAYQFYSKSYTEALSTYLQLKMDYVTHYSESYQAEMKKADMATIFDLRQGDFSFRELMQTSLTGSFSLASAGNPVYFNYNDPFNGLIKSKLQLSDKTFYFIITKDSYLKGTPSGIKTGDSFGQVLKLLGQPNAYFSYSAGMSYAVFWDKNTSNTGLFLEVKRGFVNSQKFFLLEN